MCKFKSAIVVRDEREKGGFRLLMSPWTESHSELITLHKLRDDERLRFARVEFSPESMDKAYLPETYRLTIDEERRPDWFDDEMQQKVADRMRAYIKSIIVDGDVALLLGGQFIIAPGAKIERAHSMVLNAICGGTVKAICGGTVKAICGGTVKAIQGGTVEAIQGGTVEAIRGGTVKEICGGTVEEIWGGTVKAIWRGTVKAIRGGTVEEIWGGTVKAIWGGTVKAIHGGTVEEIWGGTVEEIWKHFSGLIGKIGTDAKVTDNRKSK